MITFDSGMNIGPNPPTAIWAATNMSLLKATDKSAKRHREELLSEEDWQNQSMKSPRVDQLTNTEQPLDFTTNSSHKNKIVSATVTDTQVHDKVSKPFQIINVHNC